eukprot:TRINITY_DN2822_c0_g1_i1.p1 TRINITY_DN2822_c0_g1~~TRINITY_DN2822_c0_g1_i1.p1  ORF type:complete len:295 (-),score=51.48 TRINITY_DN2822_c0_g1_i1:50-934(-)
MNAPEDVALAQFRRELEASSSWDGFSCKARVWALQGDVLRRYLCARGGHVAKATAMLVNTVVWRRQTGLTFPITSTKEGGFFCGISPNDLATQIRTGKNYHHGHDQWGRPLTIMRVKRDCDGAHWRDKLRFMVFQMERGRWLARSRAAGTSQTEESDTSRAPASLGGVSWLFDCSGFGYKNIELRLARDLASTLQNHYPEQLGLLLIVHAPWVFRTFWNTIKTFVDPVTVRKVVFAKATTPEELREELSPYVEPGQLESCFGGDDPYEFDPDRYMEELRREEERATRKSGQCIQ